MTMLSFLGLFLLFGTSCGQEPFDGIDHKSYTDWLQSVSYIRSIYLPGSSSGEGAAVHWSLLGDEIHLAVAVRATGWAAFGISENGGMRGADMLIFNAEDEELVDAYVLDDLFPLVDACQSWTLRNAQVDNGFLIFEASRLLNTGDTQDKPLFDDSSILIPANRIIAAWGDQPSYAYHGPNRARGSIRFFGNAVGDASEIFQNVMDTEAEGSFELRANDFLIPTRATEYKSFCFLESDLIEGGMPEDISLHSIGIEPIVDERSALHVHHFLIYGSTDPNSCGSLEVVYAWAPGTEPMRLPPTVGIPLGTGGFRALRVQIHYNNPSNDFGVLDSSGVRVFYTRQKREFDLGSFLIGDPLIGLRGEPVGNGLAAHDFMCRSECSAWLTQPVTVLFESLHMHASGRRMINSQIRDSSVIRAGVADYFDFDQQGSLRVIQEPFVLQPGDAFQTRCYYDSKGGEFGEGSADEMCIAFLFYYPRQMILDRFSYTCGYDYPFPACSTDWTHEDLTSAADLDRSFGPAPTVCPQAPPPKRPPAPVEATATPVTPSPTPVTPSPTPSGSSSKSTVLSGILALFGFAVCRYIG